MTRMAIKEQESSKSPAVPLLVCLMAFNQKQRKFISIKIKEGTIKGSFTNIKIVKIGHL